MSRKFLWLSVRRPAGVHRSLAITAFFLLILGAALQSIPAGAAPAVQEEPAPDPALPADVQVGGEFTHPRLSVAGQTVIDESGTHMGRPRISPDGEILAVTLVPAGTETAGYAQIYLFERHTGRLLDRLPGHSPRWQDSRQLIYQSEQGRSIYDTVRRRSIQDPRSDGEERTIPPAPAMQPPAYPQTIRVAHHPENNCREVPDWQVDVIPFEDYVAHAVPAEVPVSWPIEAIKAQAVAARTYAWHKIRNGPVYTPEAYGRVAYDVTDWANFQMMCADDYPRSNQATAMTAGQYLSAQGDATGSPIIAMYSAKNGHPTLDNPNASYLRAVPDLTGLGEERWGHGYGLSQWGAERRARKGHTYRQILGHYYTDVHLQNALDPAQPIAGLLGLEPDSYLPSGGLRWNTLAPATPLSSHIVVSSPGGLTRTTQITATTPVSANQIVTGPLTLSGRRGVWHYPLQLGDGVPVNISLWLAGTLQETLSLAVDRTPPAPPSLTAPATAEEHIATLAIAAGEADRIGLRNDWIWQGENLPATTGVVALERTADGGAVRLARPGEHNAGVWYGPYVTGIPHATTYRALFRLRMGEHPAHSADGTLPDQPVARLDVTDRGGELRLGLRDIWASDFPSDGAYVEIPVDFHVFDPVMGLELRVAWFGDVELALDRVQLFMLHAGNALTTAWPLSIGQEWVTVTAVAFDPAGNVSSPVTRTVRVIDEHPPSFVSIDWPQGWQTRLPITLTATVMDRGSGLDTSSGALLVNGDPTPATFSQPGDPGAQQQMTAVLTNLVEGQHALRFQVADRLGNLRQSEIYTLAVDLLPPLPAARALGPEGEALTGADGWFAGPLHVEISGEDSASRISALAYVLDGAPFVLYTEPFPVATEGQHTVRYWAQDNAGHYSASHYFNLDIDSTPPTVTVGVHTAVSDTVTVVWQGEDRLSGVAAYQIEVQRGDGAWAPLVLEDATATTATVHFEEAEPPSVRVKAVDRVGNESEWTTISMQTFDHRLYLPRLTRN